MVTAASTQCHGLIVLSTMGTEVTRVWKYKKVVAFYYVIAICLIALKRSNFLRGLLYSHENKISYTILKRLSIKTSKKYQGLTSFIENLQPQNRNIRSLFCSKKRAHTNHKKLTNSFYATYQIRLTPINTHYQIRCYITYILIEQLLCLIQIQLHPGKSAHSENGIKKWFCNCLAK